MSDLISRSELRERLSDLAIPVHVKTLGQDNVERAVLEWEALKDIAEMPAATCETCEHSDEIDPPFNPDGDRVACHSGHEHVTGNWHKRAFACSNFKRRAT